MKAKLNTNLPLHIRWRNALIILGTTEEELAEKYQISIGTLKKYGTKKGFKSKWMRLFIDHIENVVNSD